MLGRSFRRRVLGEILALQHCEASPHPGRGRCYVGCPLRRALAAPGRKGAASPVSASAPPLLRRRQPGGPGPLTGLSASPAAGVRRGGAAGGVCAAFQGHLRAGGSRCAARPLPSSEPARRPPGAELYSGGPPPSQPMPERSPASRLSRHKMAPGDAEDTKWRPPRQRDTAAAAPLGGGLFTGPGASPGLWLLSEGHWPASLPPAGPPLGQRRQARAVRAARRASGRALRTGAQPLPPAGITTGLPDALQASQSGLRAGRKVCLSV